MTEEELDLTGNPIPTPHPALDHKIEARTGDLREVVKGTTSNEELLRLVMSTPTDKLIPWETCDLPSEGRFYLDSNKNPWPDGTIMVRAMTQVAEKILATQRLADSGESIDYLFTECCKFPDGFDPVDLLIGDRMFLLYYLRGITHGNMYEFALTCTNEECGKVSTHTYDLNELARTIKRVDLSLGAEPFKIMLPYMSRATGKDFWVRVRFLRGIDINNMVARRKTKQRLRSQARPGQRNANPFQRRQEQQHQRAEIDQSLTENMSRNIVDVMGVADPIMISQLVDRLHAQDTAAIREWLRENTPGIDASITVDCPECRTTFTVELPVTETFFRPTQPAGV